MHEWEHSECVERRVNDPRRWSLHGYSPRDPFLLLSPNISTISIYQSKTVGISIAISIPFGLAICLFISTTTAALLRAILLLLPVLTLWDCTPIPGLRHMLLLHARPIYNQVEHSVCVLPKRTTYTRRRTPSTTQNNHPNASTGRIIIGSWRNLSSHQPPHLIRMKINLPS